MNRSDKDLLATNKTSVNYSVNYNGMYATGDNVFNMRERLVSASSLVDCSSRMFIQPPLVIFLHRVSLVRNNDLLPNRLRCISNSHSTNLRNCTLLSDLDKNLLHCSTLCPEWMLLYRSDIWVYFHRLLWTTDDTHRIQCQHVHYHHCRFGSAIPNVRYSDGPPFRRSAIPRVRYSEGPLFQRSAIPRVYNLPRIGCKGRLKGCNGQAKILGTLQRRPGLVDNAGLIG